jgi:hypothetical protein
VGTYRALKAGKQRKLSEAHFAGRGEIIWPVEIKKSSKVLSVFVY